MNSLAQPQLERFPPQLLYHLLAAARRFEPDFYAHLCRELHVDADRVLGLFDKVEEAGPGQLVALLALLREHSSYHDIVFLAGRNAFLMAAKDAGATSAGGGATRFGQLIKQVLPEFLGAATYHFMSKGAVQFIEVNNSLYARGAHALRPLCGFYAGFFSECGNLCSEGRSSVTEVRCRATDAEAHSCMFQVAL